MGKILKVKKFTTLFEALIVVVALAVILTGVYFVSPGLRVAASKTLTALNLSSDNLDNAAKGSVLPLPSDKVSDKVSDKPLMRIAEYAWNGNSGMVVANGGPKTTKGSLMENAGINLEIVRLDGVNDLRNMLIKFCEEMNKGTQNPTSDKSAFAVSIMGDGAPFFITTTQKALDEKFGKGKYHVQAFGAYGVSYGEDKVIGPREWKDNPKVSRDEITRWADSQVLIQQNTFTELDGKLDHLCKAIGIS